MRAALVAVVLVAACTNDRGILVDVSATDPTVTKVRLFVGTGDPTTHDLTIAGPHHLDGAVYYSRDSHDTNDVVELSGGPRVAKFAYATSDAIPLVIAVGYDANDQPVTGGVLHDLAAPSDRNHVIAYQLELEPDVAVFGTNGEVHLGLWSNVDEPGLAPYSARCAGIQIGNAEPAYFVVTDGDQDCDGYPTGSESECTPNIYDGATVASADRPTCLLSEANPVTTTRNCYLGGQSCQDGLGIDPTSPCTQTHICVPATVCMSCTDLDFACAADLDGRGQSAAAGPYYACTLPARAGVVCETRLRLERPPTGGYGCSDFQIANDPDRGFGTKITSNGIQIVATGGKDTSDTSATSDASCDATLDVASGMVSVDARQFTALTNYTLVNNGGIAIPIEFTVVDSVSSCMDSIVECQLRNDVTPTASDQPRCAAGWSTPQPVSLFGAAVGGGVTLTPDARGMFYAAGGALHYATRPSSTSTGWTAGPAIAIGVLSEIRAPKLSADGSTLMFVATGATDRSLYEAPVLDSGTLGTPVPVFDSEANTGRAIDSASYTPDSSILVIAATLPDSPLAHLYEVPRLGGALGPGTALPLDSTTIAYESQPSVSANGLHLYYQSNRDGLSSIYVSSRATLGDSFDRSVRIDELGTVTDQSGFPVVAADNTELYFNPPASGEGVMRATRSAL